MYPKIRGGTVPPGAKQVASCQTLCTKPYMVFCARLEHILLAHGAATVHERRPRPQGLQNPVKGGFFTLRDLQAYAWEYASLGLRAGEYGLSKVPMTTLRELTWKIRHVMRGPV